MPLLLSRMVSADFPRAFEILSLAFGRGQPVINEFYPQHDTHQGRVDGAKRLHDQESDPNATFLKVVDTDLADAKHPDGTMVGTAKWTICNGSVSPPLGFEGPWWDDGRGDRAYAEQLVMGFFAHRAGFIEKSKGHVAALDMIAVDPAHQRHGAGYKLVEWGVKKADDLNLAAVVEASNNGAPLYKHFGFQVVESVSLDMPEPWAQLPRQSYDWMQRPRVSDGKLWD